MDIIAELVANNQNKCIISYSSAYFLILPLKCEIQKFITPSIIKGKIVIYLIEKCIDYVFLKVPFALWTFILGPREYNNILPLVKRIK